MIPLLLQNIHDLQNSIFDRSLLFSSKRMAAILLHIVDLFIAIQELLLPTAATIEKRFDFHERKFLPTDFKGVEINIEDDKIIL